MDGNLIESIAEATDGPLSPLARARLRIDTFIHDMAASAWRRWDKSAVPRRLGPLGRAIETRRKCGLTVLCRDPYVFLTPIGGIRPLWMVEALSPYFEEQRTVFLLLVYWSLEYPRAIETVRKNVEWHRRRFPKHCLVFLCNTLEEQRLLDAVGVEAILLNHNQIVSEKAFRPLDHAIPTFDAVYNAKLARFKRHQLAHAIDRVLYVAYRCPVDMPATASRAYLRRILSRSPLHQLANPIVDGLPQWLDRRSVNDAYNRAAVGLCLSPVEGAMFASVEYLVAGLPLVTTPSRGGRDHFFDPDFCITTEPDPRLIRDAVVALRDRRIPRTVVRERTLKRVEAERERARRELEGVLARHGIVVDVSSFWPPAEEVVDISFEPVRSHVAKWRPHSGVTV